MKEIIYLKLFKREMWSFYLCILRFINKVKL